MVTSSVEEHKSKTGPSKSSQANEAKQAKVVKSSPGDASARFKRAAPWCHRYSVTREEKTRSVKAPGPREGLTVTPRSTLLKHDGYVHKVP